MHFQFLIEDQSGKALIDCVMQEIQKQSEAVTYDSKSFRGIGGFTKRNTVKETKTGKLLNDLNTYLRGFNRSLQNYPAVIVVVLDNDKRDTAAFRAQLEEIAQNGGLTVDHLFCLAVEEMEAWLLGDEEAVLTAYPHAKQTLLHSYVQDSLCGTWELLADAIYPGGHQAMKKNCSSYAQIGKIKSEWALNIGIHMNFSANKSPSFQYFIGEIHKRVTAAG